MCCLPENGEQPHYHHWKEIAHYPLEDHGEDEEDGTDEEEDAAIDR
jgi:hypothetical protein